MPQVLENVVLTLHWKKVQEAPTDQPIAFSSLLFTSLRSKGRFSEKKKVEENSVFCQHLQTQQAETK